MQTFLHYNNLKKEVNHAWLSKFFHKDYLLSDEENDYYVHRFGVYKCGSCITLECEIMVTMPEKKISVHVYDGGTRNRYAPFYYTEYGNYQTIMSIICGRIEKELKKMGIKIRDNSRK